MVGASEADEGRRDEAGLRSEDGSAETKDGDSEATETGDPDLGFGAVVVEHHRSACKSEKPANASEFEVTRSHVTDEVDLVAA